MLPVTLLETKQNVNLLKHKVKTAGPSKRTSGFAPSRPENLGLSSWSPTDPKVGKTGDVQIRETAHTCVCAGTNNKDEDVQIRLETHMR